MTTTPTITQRDYWGTPDALVASVSSWMQTPPTVDLCATRENAKAFRHVFEEEDLFSIDPAETVHRFRLGLGGRWAWMNPPYSRGNLPRFTEYAAQVSRAGGVVALLVPHSSSDGWFQANVLPNARALLVPSRRVQFIPPEGVKPSSNSGQNVVAVLALRRPWERLEPIVDVIYW